jgi:hypothetical protein
MERVCEFKRGSKRVDRAGCLPGLLKERYVRFLYSDDGLGAMENGKQDVVRVLSLSLSAGHIVHLHRCIDPQSPAHRSFAPRPLLTRPLGLVGNPRALTMAASSPTHSKSGESRA